MLSEQEFNAIQAGAKVETVEIDGTTYTTKPVHDPRAKEPEQSALAVATLTGLVEYVAAHEPEDVVAHVVAFDRVDLVSRPFGRFHQRHGLAVAKAAWPEGLKFGQYADVESFVVQLQALYEQTETRDKVLAVVGNIRDEAIQQTEDDGATQTVTIKTGIARVGTATVPNPVLLQPYRTFREIEQPESRFVLRLRSGTPPSCALFEADGGAWKLEAVARIKAWLAETMPDGFAVIG